MKHHHHNGKRPQGAPSHRKAAARRREDGREPAAPVAERKPNRRRKDVAGQPGVGGTAATSKAPEPQGRPRFKPARMTAPHRWAARPIRMLPNGDGAPLRSDAPEWAMGLDMHDGELSQVHIGGVDVPVLARARADVDGLDVIEVLALWDKDAGQVVAVSDLFPGIGLAAVLAICTEPEDGRYVDVSTFANVALARCVARACGTLEYTLAGGAKTLGRCYLEA